MHSVSVDVLCIVSLSSQYHHCLWCYSSWCSRNDTYSWIVMLNPLAASHSHHVHVPWQRVTRKWGAAADRRRTGLKRNRNVNTSPTPGISVFVVEIRAQRLPSNRHDLPGDVSPHFPLLRLFAQLQGLQEHFHAVCCNSVFSRTSCCTGAYILT